MKRSAPPRRGKPPRPVSAKRAAERDERAETRERVFKRDNWRCCFADVTTASACSGVLTLHHVLRSSAGGDYSDENLKACCAHHNSLMESDADFATLARSLGLLKRSWER